MLLGRQNTQLQWDYVHGKLHDYMAQTQERYCAEYCTYGAKICYLCRFHHYIKKIQDKQEHRAYTKRVKKKSIGKMYSLTDFTCMSACSHHGANMQILCANQASSVNILFLCLLHSVLLKLRFIHKAQIHFCIFGIHINNTAIFRNGSTQLYSGTLLTRQATSRKTFRHDTDKA